MESVRRRFLPNLASNLGQVVAGLITSVLLVRVQITTLGADGNGAWVLLASLGEILGLLELGVGSAVLKLLSEDRGRGDADEAGAVLRIAFRFHLVAAAVAVVVSLVLAGFLPAWFELVPALVREARLALVIVGVDLAVTLATSPFRLALQARHRFDVVNWFTLARWLVRFCILWWGLPRFSSLVFLATVSFAVNLVVNILTSVIGARQQVCPGGALDRVAIRGLPRRVSAYAAWVLLSMLGSRLAYSADSVIIGAFLGPVEVTAYYAAWKVVEVIRAVGQAVVPFFLPLVSERSAQGSLDNVPVIFYQGVRAVILVTYPLCAVVLGLGDTVLEAWLGVDFVRYYPLLLLLMTPQLAIMTVYPSAPIAYGLARHRPMVLYGLVASVANLGLSLLLVRDLGIYGVGLGTAITLTLCAAINLRFHPWLIGFERRVYLRIVGRGAAVLLLAVALLRLLRGATPNPWIQLSIGLAIAPAVAVGFAAWELTRAERAEFTAAVRSALREVKE